MSGHDKTFGDRVFADLFADPSDSTLRTEETVHLWVAELVRLVGSLESQFANARAEEQMERTKVRAGLMPAEEAASRQMERIEWRRRTNGIKNRTVARLVEAKAVRRELQKSTDKSLRYLYRQAIETHRWACAKADIQPSAFDEHLWLVLDVTEHE